MNKSYQKNTARDFSPKGFNDYIYKRSNSPILKTVGINAQTLSNLLGDKLPGLEDSRANVGYKEFGIGDKKLRDDAPAEKEIQPVKPENFDWMYGAFLEDERLPKHTELKSMPEVKKSAERENSRKDSASEPKELPNINFEEREKQSLSGMFGGKLPGLEDSGANGGYKQFGELEKTSADGKTPQGLLNTGVLNQRLWYGKDNETRYLINNYKSTNGNLSDKTLNTLNSITAQDMQNGYDTALQTLKNNMRLGNLSKEDLELRPHMVPSLALYYTASEKGLHNIANNAWKLAYTDIPQNNKPVVESVGEQESEHPILDGVSNALAVMSLIPGLDSATNLVSVFVDAARGDWLSVGLDLAGALPVVGELADAAKTAYKVKKAVKVVDKVTDAARVADKAMDAARTVDKAADIAKTADKAAVMGKKSDFLINLYKKSATDASRAKGISKLMGKSGNAEFISGFAESFTSKIAEDLLTKKIGERASSVIGNVVGSALTAAAGEIVKGEKSAEEILKESAKAAASGLFSELTSQQIGYAINMADEAGSAARELMKYDAEFGELLQAFFDELYMAMEIGIGS